MKYSALTVLFVYLFLALYSADSSIFSVVWFSAPVLITIIIEILYLQGKVKSRVIVITGLIVLTLASPVYISELTYSGSDAQAGLEAAVIPIYQVSILLTVSFFAAVIRVLDKE